jgi:hypothetical protein
MEGEKKTGWNCVLKPATEQDPTNLMELVREINSLMEEKERLLEIDSQKYEWEFALPDQRRKSDSIGSSPCETRHP